MKFHHKLIVAVFALIFAISPMARAADLIVTIQQVGSDVVMTGSGSVNTAGLSLDGPAQRAGSVSPSTNTFTVGSPNTISELVWSGLTGTPPSFGKGSNTLASSGTGDTFSVNNSNIYVPFSYISGAALSGQSTFLGTTIGALGLTTGRYNWTWGSRENAGSAVLTIGAVPEPSTYALATIATGVMAAVARRR